MTRRFAFLYFVVVAVQAFAQPLEDDMPVLRAIPAKSIVYFATDSRALVGGYTPAPLVVQGMVDAVVMAATQKLSAAAAWGSLVDKDDIVGIKVAASPGRLGGTHPAVVRAIARGLRAAGVPVANIIVWDRSREDLLNAGYLPDDPDYTLQWIDPATGYDREATLTAPVLGRLVWGDSKFGDREGTRLADMLSHGEQLSSTSYYATVLSRKVTKVINVPSLCDSYMTGINGALANMTIWNVDNWRRFIKEPDFGNPYLPEIYADPMIREKVVLTILDGLALQFAGGPFSNPNCTRPYLTIFASSDPVALDGIALRLIDEYRILNKLPKVTEVAGHVATASMMGLGNAEEANILQIRVGTGTR